MNDITTEADTGISVGKDESDTMSMREQISDIRYAGTTIGRGVADAILEALPDMIAPLVWVTSENGNARKTKVSLGIQYRMQVALSGRVMWSVNTVKGWHNAADEVEAADHIDTHHRAAIMAAFTGETK
jgi:hypothetical protein